jgi:putative antirepressor - phage associated protein
MAFAFLSPYKEIRYILERKDFIMDSIQIFKNEAFGEVRVAGTSEKPLFCLADVCKSLGLRVDAVQSRLSDAPIRIGVTDSLGREQQMNFVNEKSLYKVIMRSDKPQAEPFQDWVCGEILPSIRKHGIYATDNVIDQILNNPDFGIELLTKLKEERSARIEAEKQVAVLTHVNKTYTCTEVAKELGLKSAIELNNRLKELGVQYKVNQTWVPYTKYATLGWFDIKQEVADNGHIIYHRKITGIGRQGIINLINP